ncbi:beta prime cop protein [Strigomonas culicis]|uniref:Coatomer subunit beta' n=1 Tax=Strigomonas culicis TaxID=28005 RepID=S9TQR5_9TRYP|nr:beta prime cop protein [Strigomonas culicis]|eukprot:EPY20682.1 beta prime cop protein [Strigomonas culicis]
MDTVDRQLVYTAHCERVKMVDMHPTEPTFVGALYSGVVNLWNYETQTLIRSFNTGTGLPIRCVRFMPSSQTFVCGCDDLRIREYNYNTTELTACFVAHDDYIRSIAVHEHMSIVLTCSDDMTIRQWDWKNGWNLQVVYEGHEHFCMCVVFNPKDPKTFASASLDQTIKVWTVNNPTPNLQLEGHEDGVNCVEYYPKGGDKPYLLSGSDDRTVRLWDYQTKTCLQVFAFRTENVTSVLFQLRPVAHLYDSRGHGMKVISSETFRLLSSLEHTSMGRAWTLASKPHTNTLIVGYDFGVNVLRVGDSKPLYSMDANGRLLFAVGNEIVRMDIKDIAATTADGEVLALHSKDMGTVETAPKQILHGPNNQFITLLGATDYTIVSTLSLRPKSYGPCLAFVWGPENGSYAILESPTTLKFFQAFKERTTLLLNNTAHTLFGGTLLGVGTSDSIVFYDWITISVVRQIDERPESVQWNPSGELVALATESSVFILLYNGAAVNAHLQAQGTHDEDGLDFAFDLVEQLDEKVKSISWIGDSLIYVSQSSRLNFYTGGEVSSIAVLSRNQYLLGYLEKERRVFCIDEAKNVTSYRVNVAVMQYMNAIAKEDFATAEKLLPLLNTDEKHKMAQFLQNRGLLEIAMAVTTDNEHRFELAVQLKNVEVAESIAVAAPSASHWKQVGDIALSQGSVEKAVHCFRQCEDYSSLLLVYSCTNDTASILELGRECMANGKSNIAFSCFHLAGQYAKGVEILSGSARPADGAFYARTYCPEQIETAVTQWKETLSMVPRVRDAIANPESFPNLFPGLQRLPGDKTHPMQGAAASGSFEQHEGGSGSTRGRGARNASDAGEERPAMQTRQQEQEAQSLIVNDEDEWNS